MEFNFSHDEYINELIECNTAFSLLNTADAIFMNHYELAQETNISSENWKRFLMHPQVSEWIASEIEIFKKTQYNKMIRNATANNRSPGAAQMINALDKSLNKETTTDGPAFIYTYVPLAQNQRQLENVREETTDIFWED